MFTGIVTNVAKVKSHKIKNKSLILSIEKPKGWKLILGESIATNGVCLTVAKIGKSSYQVNLMSETLSKTIFGKFIPDRINLERSLKLGDRLGGHIVSGHIDTVGKVESVSKIGSSKVITISFPKKFSILVIPKGSITLDGVSLTVLRKNKGRFSVSLVEHTLKNTTLQELKKGSIVNLEFDILAKYVHNR
jgi:riboflavin synthase